MKRRIVMPSASAQLPNSSQLKAHSFFSENVNFRVLWPMKAKSRVARKSTAADYFPGKKEQWKLMAR
jgi:hypothetical protein